MREWREGRREEEGLSREKGQWEIVSSSRLEPAVCEISFASVLEAIEKLEIIALDKRRNQKEQETWQASALQKLEKQIFTQT